jgi:uncharacterized Zn finger protein
MSWGFRWRSYVPVGRRKANAKAHAVKLAKKEKRTLAPVELVGRTIAASFWGKAWCDNLERYSDFANRLPRGRTYVRNGSVIDLQIEPGKIKALVSGSEIYRVTIDIKTVPAAVWSQIKKDCSRSIDSLMELLQGKFDHGIMERLSRCDGGLFPQPKEIEMACSCPDWAGVCKHVAATLYGVGARLDTAPELLFTLRAVDHLELISQAVDAENISAAFQGNSDTGLSGSDLGEIFGIEMEDSDSPETRKPDGRGREPRPRPNPKPTVTAARRSSKAPKIAMKAPRKKRKTAASA